MKTILALASLICALWSQGETSFAASEGERNEEFFLEAALEGCCDEGDKRWKGHVQRVLETVDGTIVRERFVARAAFSTKSLQFESNRATAKKGVVLKLSNANGP